KSLVMSKNRKNHQFSTTSRYFNGIAKQLSMLRINAMRYHFVLQAEDGIRDFHVTGVQTCALPIYTPAWTPDGEFLIGRKHFTSRRSLGAGELWMYHASGGGKGLQLVEKKNEQQDLGEPSVSPDGRYVYFSQDVSPGPTFEYNRNPHGVIYAIKRLDRQTGEIDTLVASPGGAVRPVPSPDG